MFIWFIQRVHVFNSSHIMRGESIQLDECEGDPMSEELQEDSIRERERERERDGETIQENKANGDNK